MYYFLYSSSLHNIRTSAEKRIGRVYTPGKVMVRGSWKDYTEIVNDPRRSMYADSKVICECESLSDIRYKPSTSVMRATR